VSDPAAMRGTRSAARRRALDILFEADLLDRPVADVLARHRADRMPLVDRNLLRLAAFELTARPEVPTAVVLDEAIELAKLLSTAESGRFVNGVLAHIATEVRGAG
jgi:N utilization substance protein B